MRYALAVLTHGDNAETLERSIRSFDQRATPPPVARFLVQDGECALPPFAPYPWTVHTLRPQQGFCVATEALWRLVSKSVGFDYVFWLEHDFDLLRTVNVAEMAKILDSDPDLAQVALMRQPVNEQEKAAGGLLGEMGLRGFDIVDYAPTHEHDQHVRHRAFFTTNPSLMTREFMLAHPFRADGAECEGRHGYMLRQFGYRFAFMGAGEPWVEHFGQRTGKGY